ncbi:MAG: aspartyl/asparaginyl beta-hydroxylase domain-containing protein [Actinomycetota bacterium]|nr:aspartyl/asparaginyl beta-hydroxylase domain-containing protein [Actinomycetota bacterium]
MPGSTQSETGLGRRDEPTADRLIAFLEAEGASRYGHGAGRSLLDHLVGTYEIAGRWEQPPWLQHAALIHSVYGTESYRPQLIPWSRRDEVIALAGEQAERLAYLFAVTPRRGLFAGTHRWTRGLVTASSESTGEMSVAPPATGDELDGLVLLHLANLADQAQASDGSPGTWLVDLRDLAEVVFDSNAVTPPLFIATLAGFSKADESACRAAYRDALAQSDPAPRAERLTMAAAICPVVAEPCVWMAYEAGCRGDLMAAHEWARTAQQRLLRLGASWDKRLRFDEWRTVITVLGGNIRERPDAATATAGDPRALYDELVHADGGRRAAAEAPPVNAHPDPANAIARFQRYMGMLADATTPEGRLLYPDLDRRPWWEPGACGLAVELESHFAEIRQEVLALDPSRFTPESERIRRTGDWDVAFFYERGRRHDEVCEACPVTTRVIEGDGALRTAAGLIYVSRMRPGTHIEAHRGPTNLRVRCHLGIAIPGGDCAIRVGDETRPWSEGSCVVFDDSFEHEAWNHTGEDRIVLIVDLWHPSLSSAEIHLLSGLHRYAAGYARRLDRYWTVNAAARREGPGA